MPPKSFLCPKYVEHVVDPESGATAKFFQISAGQFSKLQCVASPVVKALVVIFSKNNQDQGVQAKAEQGESGTIRSESTTLPIDPELAAARFKQRQDAFDGVVTALMSPQTHSVLAEIILDSMREEYPRPIQKPAVDEFLRDCPLPQMVVLLKGVWAANKGLLGPLADMVPTIDKSKLTEFLSRNGAAASQGGDAPKKETEPIAVAA